MEQDDYRWFATQIVRMGERFPDRIGLAGMMVDDTGNRCLIGEIGNAVVCGDVVNHVSIKVSYWPHRMDSRVERIWNAAWAQSTSRLAQLARSAFSLNDQGTRWGDIPKLLGLVPGEFQGGNDEEAGTGAGVLVAATDVVCGDAQAQLDDAGAGQRGDVHGAGADSVAAELVCTG